MRFEGSLPVSVLSLTETVERCLEHLDALRTYSKRNACQRNCTCSTGPSSSKNSVSRLDEGAQEQLLKEVEAALQNASLVWDATHESSYLSKKHVKGSSSSKIVEQPKRAGIHKTNPKTSIGHKIVRTNCPKAYKPVYQTAPYKTEVVRPRKHPVRHPPKVDTHADIAKSASHRLLNVDSKADIYHNSSAFSVEHPFTLVKPTGPLAIGSQCFRRVLTADDGLVCACLEEKRLATMETFVSKLNRFLSLLNDYNFCHADSSGWNFLSTFNAQLIERGEYSSIVVLLSHAYDEAIRLFGHFRHLVEFLDMHLLDAKQILWIRQVFEHFLLLRDSMRTCLHQVSEKSVDISISEDTIDDPLGSWLSSVKGDNSVGTKPLWTEHWPLKAYFTIGPGSTNCTSRLFLLTSLCNFHTLHGNIAQRDEFIRLWESLESEQIEISFLRTLQDLLPQLTSLVLSHSNRASLFRELYGLVSSSYPVALKDSFCP